MGETVVTPEFIAFMSAIYYFRFPGGLGMRDEFWWFIIPALTSLCISRAVKILQTTVGPTTWKKMEWHANLADCVADMFGLIAIHQAALMALSDSFWMRFTVNWFCIGGIGVTCVIVIPGVVKGGK